MKNLEGDEFFTVRRRTTMALVVVGQMLPAGAVKGGSAMALRYGGATRFTRDFDAACAGDFESFRADFEERLQEGWSGFTGRLVERTPPQPAGIPLGYVMQPFDVKLDWSFGQPTPEKTPSGNTYNYGLDINHPLFRRLDPQTRG